MSTANIPPKMFLFALTIYTELLTKEHESRLKRKKNKKTKGKRTHVHERTNKNDILVSALIKPNIIQSMQLRKV